MRDTRQKKVMKSFEFPGATWEQVGEEVPNTVNVLTDKVVSTILGIQQAALDGL